MNLSVSFWEFKIAYWLIWVYYFGFWTTRKPNSYVFQKVAPMLPGDRKSPPPAPIVMLMNLWNMMYFYNCYTIPIPVILLHDVDNFIFFRPIMRFEQYVVGIPVWVLNITVSNSLKTKNHIHIEINPLISKRGIISRSTCSQDGNLRLCWLGVGVGKQLWIF